MSPTFFATFQNTLWVGIAGTVICLLVGLPVAYWMAVKAPPSRRGLLVALVMVPFWTNFLVRTIGWQVILAPEGWLSSTLQAVGQIIDGTRSANELGGIIRIGAIAGDMAKTGIIALVTFTALLSINLGLINLFPIPMLDGGHLLFYGVESLKGSPIPERIQEYAFRVGLAMLVGIMVFANLNDLIQLIL